MWCDYWTEWQMICQLMVGIYHFYPNQLSNLGCDCSSSPFRMESLPWVSVETLVMDPPRPMMPCHPSLGRRLPPNRQTFQRILNSGPFWLLSSVYEIPFSFEPGIVTKMKRWHRRRVKDSETPPQLNDEMCLRNNIPNDDAATKSMRDSWTIIERAHTLTNRFY